MGRGVGKVWASQARPRMAPVIRPGWSKYLFFSTLSGLITSILGGGKTQRQASLKKSWCLHCTSLHQHLVLRGTNIGVSVCVCVFMSMLCRVCEGVCVLAHVCVSTCTCIRVPLSVSPFLFLPAFGISLQEGTTASCIHLGLCNSPSLQLDVLLNF